ncbi:unnamed protein product [Arabis nemorensis]|uniref:Uncharacterized protein n=1 Tax=Arabis nemorensis TaxID=586526 RepID=A0A565BUZ5_9BRAS|nr:unnamed protein product [Arabis nemorensis]
MTKSPGKVTEDPSPGKLKRVVASDKGGGSKSKKQKCTAIVKVESKVVPMTQHLRTRDRIHTSKTTTTSTPLDVDDDSGDSGSGNRDSVTHQGSYLYAGTGAGASGTAKGRHAFQLEEMVEDPEDIRLAFMKRYEEHRQIVYARDRKYPKLKKCALAPYDNRVASLAAANRHKVISVRNFNEMCILKLGVET